MTASRRRQAAAAALALAAGAALAAEKAPEAVPAQAQVCAACHGANGVSANAAMPSLAGQPKQFITTQLVMFREGNRKNPAMAALSAAMSNADINIVGAYFAAQAPAAAGAAVSGDAAAAGRRLVEQYNCVQCHGPDLKGQQHIPRLAGQQPGYLREQLLGFKAMTRFDMDGNMTSAAQPLTAAAIDALAEYMAGLR